jgi:hypothetical protein
MILSDGYFLVAVAIVSIGYDVNHPPSITTAAPLI